MKTLWNRPKSAILLLAIALPTVVHGQANSWTNTNFGKWETNSNWSLGVAPTNSHSVFITNFFSKTVTIDLITAGTASMTVSNLKVSAAAGSANTLSLFNSGSVTPLRVLQNVIISTNGSLLVGSNSLLQVDRVGAAGFISVEGGGFVLFSGGSLIATTANISVGSSGNGTMVLGQGTRNGWALTVGGVAGSQGTLSIDGGTNRFTDTSSLGINVGATGTVWLTGGLLETTNIVLNIGSSGVGRMTVSNGTWLARFVRVGLFSASRGTLTYAGGTNVVSEFLRIGEFNSGTGTVLVSAGRLFVTNVINTGSIEVRTGSFTVDGGTVVADRLVATNSSANIQFLAGTMTLRGAEVANGLPFFVGESTKSAVLNLAGGTNRFASFLVVGTLSSTGIVWMTDGRLIVTNASTYIASEGVGQMTVSNGTWQAEEVIVGLAPFAKGTLTLAGGTNIFSGRLVVTDDPLAVGAMWMTGGLLTTTNKEMIIAEYKSAQMTISNGTWRARHVIVGNSAGANGLLTVAGGVSSVYSNLTVGFTACTSTGIVNVTGGALRVTNNSANAVLEVRSGTLTQSGGILDIDRLVVTNPCARFIHTGGTLITGLITPLPPGLDADGDGIPNQYELDNGLDPFNPADAALDNDGEGQSNLEEFTMGTDPNDANSRFRITSILVTNNNVRITWTIAVNRDYIVQYGTNLLTGVTNNLSPVIFAPAGSGPTTNYTDFGGATNRPARFYRLWGFPD